ncbi:hypothetical protein D9M71_605250 [compost metagenome]
MQQLDADLAIAHAVIQQQAVLTIKMAIQVHPAICRIIDLQQLRTAYRVAGTTLGVGLQQLAFLLGTPELPAAERNQPRQQQQHHQGRHDAGAKARHRALERSVAILVLITASPRSFAMLKAAIVLMLLATIASLFSGLFFLVKDDGQSTRLLKALTVRVTLAALTLALVTWGFYSGQLVSHAPF